ncbi:MAG: threonine--tRNA ligase [Candidatus Dormibacteraeota bacterium]|nr:threonine--tRNA ligase [Candidatus Dormibacteraeota bacterium]
MAEYDAEASSDPLYVLRHSTAHVLAAAVTDLYAGTRYAGGPPVENGFYYDFELPRSIGEDDLPQIESRMREIVARGDRFEHVVLSHGEAALRFEALNQPYKLYWVNQKASPDEAVSCYTTGAFFDLCRGPHLASAADIPAFRLMRLAGAYWLGDEAKPQLTRIYGTAWPSELELEDYLKALAEAEQRDHKRLGPQLKLFRLDERTGPGNVIWLPDGATIRRELERWIVDEELARGYQHVVTPVFARLDLYRQSGHWDLYRELMYPPMRHEAGEDLELKPVNCPHHILVYESDLRSYRDLPLRIAEVGNNYRWEKSGELMGMIRVRSFALNDAHIFCTPEQLHAEVLGAIEISRYFMRTLGVDEYTYRVSVRDEQKAKYLGSDEQWANAERALMAALDEMGESYSVGVGDAAFYGPKIDFQVRDAMRREFTNSTVQVDFQLPERFQLEYVAADGSRQRPVMVHRGAFGSMERMIAYLIELYAGAFPTWLAPHQVAVLPITDAHVPYAREVEARLRAVRVRATVDNRSERIGKKIREAQARKVAYMAVVGGREAEAGTVQVRDRAGGQWAEPLDEFVDRLLRDIAERRR